MAVVLTLLLIAPVMSFLDHFAEDAIPKLYPHRPAAKVRYFSIQWYMFGGLLAQGGSTRWASFVRLACLYSTRTAGEFFMQQEERALAKTNLETGGGLFPT